MEPPGGVPPDRGRQPVVQAVQHTPASHSQAQPQHQNVPLAQGKQALTLNLPQPPPPTHPPPTTSLSSSTSPALSAVAAASNSNAATTLALISTPALASTATALSATQQAATAFSGVNVGHTPLPHHQQPQQHSQATPLQPHNLPLQHNSSNAAAALLGVIGGGSGSVSGQSSTAPSQQQPIDKLSRPMAFDKMESLVREMQDPEHGVPVRQQKMFLTSIPYAFMGYDLIEWLMDRLLIEESEALNIANQLCLHGYFFPVNDTKTLAVKDDSSLYRFQTPYYWPWQHKAPDNVEYAIYLAKRSLRNKQRHALEDYEAEALASLHKNLKGKWEFISMQAEEQVRLAKERKKGDKIVGDSQERAYWRVHRPPPGQFTPLEPCPIPSRDRQGIKPNKKKTVEDMQREVDYLNKSLNRTRMKMSQACESLINYSETFSEYDFFLQPVLPSNPWVTEDVTFWQLNNTFVDIPTEKRVKRWAISIEELVSDPTGLQEFTSFLEKEYSHENIRFWIAVNRLRRSAHSQVARKVNDIYEEFLKPGAPCEINIDGKTMESVLKGLKNPSRFTFDAASEHIYMLLLKKDCYPRFIRSDHFKRLLETGIQPSHKKRFFNFGGVGGAKKKMTAALSSQPNLGDGPTSKMGGTLGSAPPPGSLARRRGSDRSLTGSAHELAVIGVNKDNASKVPHSHSQSNLSEIPYRETPKPKAARLETTVETASSAVCPWDLPDEPSCTQTAVPTQVQLSVCPWEQEDEIVKPSSQRLTSTSSDNSDVSERNLQRNQGIRHQNTVDSGEAGMKRLIPNFTEQRRASMSITPSRISEYQFGRPSSSAKTSTTPSPTVSTQRVSDSCFPPLFAPLQTHSAAVTAVAAMAFTSSTITKDPPSSSDAEIEEELHKLSISERSSESSASDLQVLPPPAPTPTPPPLTKITPPPPENNNASKATEAQSSEIAAAHRSDSSNAGPAVESIVQEVHIELIKSTQQLLEINTPTIQVQEACLVETEAASPIMSPIPSPTRKYAQKLHSVEVVKEEPEDDVEIESSDQSPEQEVNEFSLQKGESMEFNNAPELPPYGPLEEELQLQEEEALAAQEELSPTTDEYQEGLQFGADSKEDYDYDLSESKGGYIPPASTPAPSMAPLAELDVDTVDDELGEEFSAITPTAVEVPALPAMVPVTTSSNEEVKKRRKKRNSDGKKVSSLDEPKDKAGTSATTATESSAGSKTEADRNTVCPWEDENVTTTDGTFVKTYATLGYL